MTLQSKVFLFLFPFLHRLLPKFLIMVNGKTICSLLKPGTQASSLIAVSLWLVHVSYGPLSDVSASASLLPT